MKNKRVQVAIIVLLLILISVCSFFVFYFYDANKDIFNFKKIDYNKRASVNYDVTLKENDYNSKDNIYFRDLIKGIDAYFNYVMAFSRKVKGEYSYYIDGNIVFTHDDKEIVRKNVIKTDKKSFLIDGKVLNLNAVEYLKVDEYVNIYKEIIKKYKFNTKAIIKVDCHIEYDINSSYLKKQSNGKEILSLSIPISFKTLSINKTKDIDTHSFIYSDLMIKNNIYFVICLEFVGAIILLILIILLIIKKMYPHESKYEKTKKKLLSEYDEYIIEVKGVPDISKKDVLFVTEFKELLDASNRLNIPIIFFETVKGSVSIFIVISNLEAFVYKIKK